MVEGRVDYRLLALVVGVAALLRFWAFGSVGLDHFDEGGYAMSAGAVAEGTFATARYPLQHFLAPPFFFGTAGLGMHWLGLHDWVLVGLSALAGVATVAVVFVLGSRWFGPGAGLATALIVALSDYQVLYARAGLTDVTFSLCFLLAIGLFAEAEERESWLFAALAGVAVGLAWNTKYHGWLACGVAAGALVLGLQHDPRQVTSRAFVRGVLRIGLASVIAIAMYAPWFVFVSGQEGGYARLVAEHTHFLQPFEAIAQTLSHVHTQLYLDGWIGRLAPGLAAVLLAVGPGRRRAAFPVVPVAVVTVIGIVLGASLFVGLAAVVAATALHRAKSAGVRTVLVFLVGFSILTPLYRPYPRLVLPWLLAASLLAGVTLVRAVRGVEALPESIGWRDWPRAGQGVLAGLALAMGVGAVWIRPPWETAHPFRPKDGFREAAAALAADLPAHGPVAVWGEPGVVFYLRSGRAGAPGRDDVWHIDGPDDLPRYVAPGESVYVVTSFYVKRGGGIERLGERAREEGGSLVSLSTYPVRHVSDVRLLDDVALDAARRFLDGDVDDYDLRLYRVTLPEY